VIQTVLGPISAQDLGPVSMHEHLLADARILQAPAREAAPESDKVSIETLGFVRWNLLALADNLVLDDPDLAATELGYAATLGQRAVVDLTCWGLGHRPADLPAIARATGMHVVAGCGVYLDRPHPPEIAARDEDALTEYFVRSLDDDFDGAGFRAGLLGLVGTSAQITDGEWRVLRAVGAAAGRTGAAVVVRLDPATRDGLAVLDALAAAGCPPSQVILGNVDEYIDGAYLGELAAAGATLEWCFGNEAYYRGGYKDPTDAERLDGLMSVLGDGLAAQCVLGCSVWTKSQLRAFGGMGYDHLLRRIVPELERRGVDGTTVDSMLIHNPARLLDR
jgi:phosphotriesterase-related protein